MNVLVGGEISALSVNQSLIVQPLHSHLISYHGSCREIYMKNKPDNQRFLFTN